MSEKTPPLAVEPPDENKLIAERRAKLTAIREQAGLAKASAFPNDFRRTHYAGELQTAHAASTAEELEAQAIPVIVAGRMLAKRVMGKASFATIADPSGRIQLFLQGASLAEVYDQFKSWDVGDTLGASGTLFRTRTGELSVKVSSLRLLAKSLRPLPDKWHGLTDVDTRYRQRYVDLIVNEASRAVFEARTRIVRRLRSELDSRGFLEVETPMMQPIPGGAAAKPFVTHHNALDMQLYLRIAPELYLKRLVVGGFEKVYEINRNFRNEGLSTRHNPEFTMMELYWAYADYHDLMDLTEQLLIALVDVVKPGARQMSYQGRDYSLATPFSRITMADAIVQNNPGIDAARLRDVEYLRGWCTKIGAKFDKSDGAGKLQTHIFDHTAEHTLLDPTFIHAYPAEVSPLARANDADPFLTDRFEFFLSGREMANGFSELNDPEDQAARFQAQVARKDAGDDEAMFYDADYIRALEYGMPPTAGLGIGVDRLVMFLTDQAAIRDVLLFPQVRHEAT
ncbi:MAG TPA: lysine--tRNA ligase [Steroidobacteraceae bacterium]|nr:lysine--tRNA ligase [Steroidobacteraceae bacterium]